MKVLKCLNGFDLATDFLNQIYSAVFKFVCSLSRASIWLFTDTMFRNVFFVSFLVLQ